MNDKLIMNNKIDEIEISKLLKMVGTVSENKQLEEILGILIPFQKMESINFSVEEFGLLHLTKRSCVKLADIYLNSELYSQAKIICEFILKYFPEDNDIQEKYSSSLLPTAEENIQNLMYDEARVLLNELINKNEKNVSAIIDLGVLDVLCFKFDEAKIKFENALKIEPDNNLALENLQYVMGTEKGK